jgi:hypothetical protein
MVLALPEELPVCILGDELQAIFNFGGRQVVRWTGIEVQFPTVARLETPWRWVNAGEETFGRWLLDVREKLRTREGVDLREAPPNVRWRQLLSAEQIRQDRLSVVHELDLGHEQTVLILGEANSRHSRANFARNVPGVSVVEPVDLPDLIHHAREIRSVSGSKRVQAVIDFAAETMTGVGTALPKVRLEILIAGRNRTATSALEDTALTFALTMSPHAAVALFRSIRNTPGVRLFRSELLEAMIEALKHSDLSLRSVGNGLRL